MDLPCLLFAGAEYCSRPSEGFLKIHCERVRTTEHAPRDPNHVLERRHGFAEIAKRGGGVLVEHPSVIRPHPERDLIILAENAPRHGQHFSKHGDSESNILRAQNNLANTYHVLGRLDEALSVRKEVYSGRLRLNGKQHLHTLQAANNYASALHQLERFDEAKAFISKIIPVTRRALGESNDLTLRMRLMYAVSLYEEPAATLDDLREAVTTLEDAGRIARRVLGRARPLTTGIEIGLRDARAALREAGGA